MPESVIPGPVSEDTQIREATCIHTNKIYDSCQSKDCMEDLLLYPTTGSQAALDDAQSLKSGRAELLYVSVDVEPVGLNRGCGQNLGLNTKAQTLSVFNRTHSTQRNFDSLFAVPNHIVVYDLNKGVNCDTGPRPVIEHLVFHSAEKAFTGRVVRRTALL